MDRKDAVSTRMTVIRAYVRWRYRARHDLSRMQRQLPDRQAPASVPPDVEEICEVRRSAVAGRTVVTLTPRSHRADVAVMHLHGGAYVYSAQAAHWQSLARLAQASGAAIHVPLYPLAPAATVDDAFPFLDDVIDRVREWSGDAPLVLSGDSAGGGLALAQAQRMRDAATPPAAGVLLFSPWVDVTLTDPAIARLERRDPMLSRRMLEQAGRWWAGSHDTADPRVSPVRGDLSGLPPVVTYAGGRDILLADARALDRGLGGAGGASTLLVWPSGFHVFMAARSTRESREVVSDAARRLRAFDRASSG